MLPATIAVPQSQFLQLANAAAWLCPADRDSFYAAAAAELQGYDEPGPGHLARAIAKAFRQFYRS